MGCTGSRYRAAAAAWSQRESRRTRLLNQSKFRKGKWKIRGASDREADTTRAAASPKQMLGTLTRATGAWIPMRSAGATGLAALAAAQIFFRRRAQANEARNRTASSSHRSRDR